MQNFSPLQKLVHDQARIYGDRVALRYRDNSLGIWKDISWKQFSLTVRRLSDAMVALGVAEQENIAVFSQNMPEGLMVDFASYSIRAVVIPLYATSSEMQVKYIVSDANIRYVFVGEQEQYDIAFRVLKHGSTLERLIVFSRDVCFNAEDQISMYFDDFLASSSDKYKGVVCARSEKVQPDDLANILYTSAR